VRAHLEASGVRLAAGADGAERTSTAQATIGEDRAATYVFDLDWNPPRPNLADGEAPLLVHTGSIAAILAPGAATVEQLLRGARLCLGSVCGISWGHPEQRQGHRSHTIGME